MAVNSKKEAKSDSESDNRPSPKKAKSTTKSNAGGRKWTEEAIKLLFDLRNQGMSWSSDSPAVDSVFTGSEIVASGHFPGRSEHALEVCYSAKHKELEEVFTSEKDAALNDAIEGYQKRMWVNIGREIGMSAGGCKKRAKEMKFI